MAPRGYAHPQGGHREPPLRFASFTAFSCSYRCAGRVYGGLPVRGRGGGTRIWVVCWRGTHEGCPYVFALRVTRLANPDSPDIGGKPIGQPHRVAPTYLPYGQAGGSAMLDDFAHDAVHAAPEGG